MKKPTIYNTPWIEDCACPKCGKNALVYDYMDSDYGENSIIEDGWAECSACNAQFNIRAHYDFTHTELYEVD